MDESHINILDLIACNSIEKVINSTDEPKIDLSISCHAPYSCPFFKYCTNYLPDKNVFDIAGMQSNTKLKLYKNGIFKYQDLLNEDTGEENQ